MLSTSCESQRKTSKHVSTLKDRSSLPKIEDYAVDVTIWFTLKDRYFIV
jgi:hypothetical protein